MHFEHLVCINEPLNPLIEPLTREQVWKGLLLRAEQPQLFLPHLENVRIVARGEACIVRELDFGSFKVRDRVHLEPMQRMFIETESASDRGIGTLIMTIEEPGSELLQLRFQYDLQRTQSESPKQEALYDRFIKAAYLEADIDCVRIIRLRAADAG